MNQLAKLLGGFDVIPKPIRIGNEVPRGYTLEQLIDPFSRYLSSPSATTLQPAPEVGLQAISDPQQEGPVADEKTGKCVEYKGCSVVADRNTLFPDSEGGGSEKPEKEQGPNRDWEEVP